MVNDGEVSKVGYSTYVTSGSLASTVSRASRRPQVEAADFPEFYRGRMAVNIKRPVCTGPITWRGDAYVQRDIANFQGRASGRRASKTRS